jgi:hypothetical protein
MSTPVRVETSKTGENKPAALADEEVLVIKFIKTTVDNKIELSIQNGSTPPITIKLSGSAPSNITTALTQLLTTENVLDNLMTAITEAASKQTAGGAIQQSTTKNNTRKRY